MSPERDAAWHVLVAAPRGRVLRDDTVPASRPALVASIERHAVRDGAWAETLEDGTIVHGLCRLGTAAVIATPPDVPADEVRRYLDALLASYGARARGNG